MSRNVVDGHATVMTKEKASSIRPILRWIKSAASRKRERVQAANILKEIEGIKDWKQIVLTRGEAELLSFVYEEFPEGTGETGEQLSLFSLLKAPKEFHPSTPTRVEEEKPTLRTSLTEEEQAERDTALEAGRYRPLPQSHWAEKLKGKGQE